MPDLQENGRETGDGPRGCKTDRDNIDLTARIATGDFMCRKAARRLIWLERW